MTDDSGFEGHLVRRPGRIEPTPGAGEGERWPPHPWVPDLAIDHDAPVCEICGEGMSAHTEESLLFQDYMRLERDLNNLLAIIHRDGGHHTGEVGTEQSVEDAHQVWGELVLRQADLERDLAAERERAEKAEAASGFKLLDATAAQVRIKALEAANETLGLMAERLAGEQQAERLQLRVLREKTTWVLGQIVKLAGVLAAELGRAQLPVDQGVVAGGAVPAQDGEPGG